MKVFFFGDSICFGQGISLHKGWVPRISSRLEELSVKLDTSILVVNSAVNGRTTRQALLDMPYEIQSYAPDILVVQFGMNDCNYWETDRGNPRVSPKAFAANLEEILTRAFSFGAKKVFLNTNHPTGRDTTTLPYSDITYQQSNERYNRIIRDVADLFSDKVILNDMETTFYKTASKRDELLPLLLSDFLHLSEKGHEVYLNTIYKKIAQEISYRVSNL